MQPQARTYDGGRCEGGVASGGARGRAARTFRSDTSDGGPEDADEAPEDDDRVDLVLRLC